MPPRYDEQLDTRQIAHAAIAGFLEEKGYQSTLASFQQDAAKAGWTWPTPGGSAAQTISLEGLVELHRSNLALQKQQRTLARKLLEKSPTELVLGGPSTLAFGVTKTHASLHSSNILHLSVIDFPSCHFSTTEERYVTASRRLLCSTAAEKRVIFSDVESGEMVDAFEPGSGPHSDDRHNAAVLWVAQNPNPDRRREFVSCGMDGKVILWDLLYQEPIQVLRDHTRFVVKCAFSPQGDYMASCGNDKSIFIYKRNDEQKPSNRSHEEHGDKPPLLRVRFELVHQVSTENNPESVVFVRAPLRPSRNDPGLGRNELVISEPSKASPDDEIEGPASKRTWIAFTTRSDSFVHYIALPLQADSVPRSSSADMSVVAADLKGVCITEGSEDQGVADWTQLHFNTNENRSDFHVSYSLMHMTVHPTGSHICIQTGDHSIPSTGYAPSSSALSRILIMPLLSSLRSTTLWTGVESSGFATIRHDWLPDGSAAWITSEEGYARLLDTKGKIRAKVSAHGAVADEVDEVRRAATWSRGGNSLIKSLVVLDDAGSVATCGYDRTIRIIQRS